MHLLLLHTELGAHSQTVPSTSFDTGHRCACLRWTVIVIVITIIVTFIIVIIVVVVVVNIMCKSQVLEISDLSIGK